MIRLQSVKVRLTLWYAFILAVLLSLFAFFMYAELARVLYQDTDRNLLQEAETLQEALVRGEKEAFERVKRSTLMVRLLSSRHEVLTSNLKGWEEEIIFPDFERDSVFMETGESFQTIHFFRKPIRLYYHLIRKNNQPYRIIQYGSSLQEVRNTLDRLSFIILISIPGAVIAACIAGWFLARHSLRPIDSMIREARQITAAYLKGRLPRTHAGDELDRLAETLNEMMGRIESSTRSIQDFSTDISHELKTPLAIIRGEIDLALRRERSPQAMMETLRVIGEEVNELIRLVDDLMILVRSDAKQLRFQMSRVSLGEILRQVADRFADRARDKKISLSVHAPKKAEVSGDSVYLKRLFSNLVDNALKFTPEGGRISIDLKIEGTESIASVSDTGMGIELEIQEKVFSRFYRTDQARSYEGAGLGLNIAKAICEAHGGAISMESSPGQGTRICVVLPLFSPLQN